MSQLKTSKAIVQTSVWAIEAVKASEVADAAEVNESGEVSMAWKITTEDFRIIRAFEFSFIFMF